MLKELEEPGKERVRHLNHRKEKAQPLPLTAKREKDMQGDPPINTKMKITSTESG